jgi:hypothetical protein
MRRLRSPLLRAFLVWTVVLLAAAILLAFGAIIGFVRAQDACFFQTAPCPGSDDPNLVQLAVAFFGIPLIWLIGVLLGAIGQALAARSRKG